MPLRASPVLLYMCPIYVSSYSYICTLYMCPRTAIYVSSHCICVLYTTINLARGSDVPLRAPHAPIYVSSCSYVCVLILLFMCPHAPICVSSYSYICVLMLLCNHICTCTYVQSLAHHNLYICKYIYTYMYTYIVYVPSLYL